MHFFSKKPNPPSPDELYRQRRAATTERQKKVYGKWKQLELNKLENIIAGVEQLLNAIQEIDENIQDNELQTVEVLSRSSVLDQAAYHISPKLQEQLAPIFASLPKIALSNYVKDMLCDDNFAMPGFDLAASHRATEAHKSRKRALEDFVKDTKPHIQTIKKQFPKIDETERHLHVPIEIKHALESLDKLVKKTIGVYLSTRASVALGIKKHDALTNDHKSELATAINNVSNISEDIFGGNTLITSLLEGMLQISATFGVRGNQQYHGLSGLNSNVSGVLNSSRIQWTSQQQKSFFSRQGGDNNKQQKPSSPEQTINSATRPKKAPPSLSSILPDHEDVVIKEKGRVKWWWMG